MQDAYYPPPPPPPPGYPQPGYGPPVPDKASGMAITALILAILGVPCCCGIFGAIPALICGFIENGRINRGASSPKGKWMALTGIIAGIIFTLLGCLAWIWYLFFGGLAALQTMMQGMN